MIRTLPMSRTLRWTLGLVGLSAAGLTVGGLAAGSFDHWTARAAPSPRTAGPATLTAMLRGARGGERIVLAPGDYGEVTLLNKVYQPAVTIDASQARFTQIMIRKVSGITIEGGTVNGMPGSNIAVAVDMSRDVALRRMRTTGSAVGISVARSQRVVVQDNMFERMRSDGVNIVGSQEVRVERNVCRDFRPRLAIYDSAGKLVKDGNHPDCIQGWSIPGRAPLADISVIGNTGRGMMQGVFFGNGKQGGVDRIVVRDNTFDISAFNGIVLSNARNAQVRNNIVRTIPGARMINYPFKPVTAWIKVRGGDGNVVCGNTVDRPRSSEDQGRCPVTPR